MRTTITSCGRLFAACVAVVASSSLLANGAPPAVYLYDELARLTRVVYPDGRQVTYAYDDMGNITRVSTLTRPSVLALVTGPLNGQVGAPLTYQILASNPALVTGYAVRGLPPGLRVNTGVNDNRDGQPGGMIYGTPTREGSYTALVSVRTVAGLGPAVPLAVNIINRFTSPAQGFDLAGGFSGALEPSDLEGGSLGGWVSLRTSRNGSISGVLTLGGVNYRIRGMIDPVTGESGEMRLARRGMSDLRWEVTMVLDPLSPERGRVSFRLRDDSGPAQTRLFREVWSRALPAEAFAGARTTRYNTVWRTDPGDNTDAHPQGLGHAGIVVNRAGVARVAGRLADGTAFSQARAIWPDGTMPVYVSLYGRQGGLSGRWPRIQTGAGFGPADNIIHGTVIWKRPPASRPGTVLFADGFETILTMFGGAYSAPRRGERVLDLGGGAGHPAVELLFSRGGLASPIQAAVTLSTANRVTEIQPNNNAIRLSFAPATGMVSGRFQANGRTAAFAGLILPATAEDASEAYGYFLMPGADRTLPTLSGSIFVGPPSP